MIRFVSNKRDATNFVARAFINDEPNGDPFSIVAFADLSADASVKVTECSIVVGQTQHVLFDFVSIDIATDQLRDPRLGLDKALQPCVGSKLIPFELNIPNTLPLVFMDQKHHSGRIIAFVVGYFDLRAWKTFFLVEIFQTCLGETDFMSVEGSSLLKARLSFKIPI